MELVKFDDSRERSVEKGLVFEYGLAPIIEGWKQGLETMCEGGKRTLIIPPELGYGERGVQGVIPGGSTLHFTVELMKIEKGRSRDEV